MVSDSRTALSAELRVQLGAELSAEMSALLSALLSAELSRCWQPRPAPPRSMRMCLRARLNLGQVAGRARTAVIKC